MQWVTDYKVPRGYGKKPVLNTSSHVFKRCLWKTPSAVGPLVKPENNGSVKHTPLFYTKTLCPVARNKSTSARNISRGQAFFRVFEFFLHSGLPPCLIAMENAINAEGNLRRIQIHFPSSAKNKWKIAAEGSYMKTTRARKTQIWFLEIVKGFWHANCAPLNPWICHTSEKQSKSHKDSCESMIRTWKWGSWKQKSWVWNIYGNQ